MKKLEETTTRQKTTVLSKLIAQLQKDLAQHGDVEVRYRFHSDMISCTRDGQTTAAVRHFEGHYNVGNGRDVI
jgi:uncharacterized protein YbcI